MLRGDFSSHWYDAPPTDERALERMQRQIAREARAVARGAGAPASVTDQLTIEAFELMQIGDIAGAQHRLRLRDRPKWGSVAESQDAYDRHMRQQRAAQQTGSAS